MEAGNAFSVIASEAKQSRLPRHAHALLAMTIMEMEKKYGNSF